MSKKYNKLIIDLDGTICPLKKEGQSYDDLVPYEEVINKIKEWKNEGFIIQIYTARNMRTYEGNLGLINANTGKSIMNWLDKWKIPYDEILFGKPWPGERGYYIDDRAIRPNEFLEYSEEQLNKILDNDRKLLERKHKE